ncbi:MAG: nucleotidyltransferase family protein [Cyanobacteria bacterium P01_F01_bin.3]
MPQKTPKLDPYQFHRTALGPVLPGSTNEDLERSCLTARSFGEIAFARFLSLQGLAPLWDECIANYSSKLPVSDLFIKLIHDDSLHSAGAYLIQRHSLDIVREALDSAGVTHVVLKGAHTREVYYTNPALRPATDIDVLVRPEEKLAAIQALQTEGFCFRGNPATISHEASLLKGYTSIDLHWDILRPGRTRQPMTGILLDTRLDYGSHWGTNIAATLFLMLVHPVFAKYSTAPQAALIRLVDILLLLLKRRQQQDIDQALQLLELSGLNTAGWITLQWLHKLTDDAATEDMGKALQPNAWRRRWLQRWIDVNRASNLLDTPWRIQIGFILPAHDRFRDGLRAALIASAHRSRGSRTLSCLKSQLD